MYPEKSWSHKEDTQADSPKYLLPCSCCRDWSKGSDMSQCEAALEDSPRCCRPHFLKQTAALARELCVLFRLLFPASSQPAAPSREPARWAVRGVTKSSPRGRASHGSSLPAPRVCRVGGGEGSRGGRRESESPAAAGVGRRGGEGGGGRSR